MMDDDDEPIRYMQRTRDWYLALGYGDPYRWAHFADVPFQPLAKPLDRASQAITLDLALRTLESAPAARTTVQSPLRWSESPEWTLDYSNPERASPEELTRARKEMDEGKAVAKAIRASTVQEPPGRFS
jgi:hypothetical protein